MCECRVLGPCLSLGLPLRAPDTGRPCVWHRVLGIRSMDQSQLKMKCAYLARFGLFCSIGFLVWFGLIWLSEEEMSLPASHQEYQACVAMLCPVMASQGSC